MAMNKDTWVVIAVVILGLLALKEFGYLGATADGTTTQVTVGGGGDVLSKLPSFNEPTLTLRAYDLYKPTTAAANEGGQVYRDGVRDANISLAGGTLAVSPKEQIKIYVGIDDETGAFYTQKLTPTIPDSPTVAVRGEVCTIDTAPTITYLDKYGQVTANNSNEWSIGTSEEYTGKVMIQAAADKCYGSPTVGKNNIGCLIGNLSTYKTVELVGQPKGTQPTSITTGSLNTTWCYEVPVIQNNDIWTGSIKVAAKSNVDPNDGGNKDINNIALHIEDIGLAIDADSGAEIIGYEDESGNDLGATKISKAVYIS